MINNPQIPETKLHPLVVLASSLVCQIFAGTLFWWPALAVGLESSMMLTPDQVMLILFVANSGVAFGFFGGMYHDHYGNWIASLTGTIGLPLSMLLLFMLTFSSIRNLLGFLCFPILFFIPVIIAAFSFMIYASSITSSVIVLPPSFRGRVIGLHSCIFGISPGVFAALQAAFFPSPSQTPHLFLFCTFFCCIPLVLVLLFFPRHKKYTMDHTSISEQESLLHTTNPPDSLEIYDNAEKHFSTRVDWAFANAACIVVVLQLAAIFEFFSLSSSLQLVCTLFVIFFLLTFIFLPTRSNYTVYPATVADEGTPVITNSLSQVLADPRYLFICAGFVFLVGGATIGLLIQLPGLALSRLYSGTTLHQINMEVANRNIRGMVIVFSAYGAIARLVVARFSDRGNSATDRQMWKFWIMVMDSLIMTVATVLVAFAPSWALYIAVGMIGFCYGTWFAITPALVTIWFGVESFARNFGFLGLFAGLGSAIFGTFFPAWIRRTLGHWEMIPTIAGEEDMTRVCIGIACYAPGFLMFAALNLLLFVAGYSLRGMAYKEAVKSDS